MSNLDVIVLDGNRIQDAADESRSQRSPRAVRELDANQELGCGDSRYRHIIVVGDQAIEAPRHWTCGVYHFPRLTDRFV